jgi:divalent metal cation (Fe/Co/Zn/Cd) transporter
MAVVGWTALILGALFVAVAIYFTGVYGGPSAIRQLFSLAPLPDLLALLAALLPGALLIWIARRNAAAGDTGDHPR